MVVDSSGGELYCTGCGFVVKEKIVDTGPETRSFSSEEGENRSRTGAPTSVTMHDMGLATVIGTDNRDSSGKAPCRARSEEHTSELQSRPHLVCRLLLEKKNNGHTYAVGAFKYQPNHVHALSCKH